MKILADENVSRALVEGLIAQGHDVIWTRVGAGGASDTEILQWALRDNRIVVTFDKDFGELAFHRGFNATCGVILLRIPQRPDGEHVLDALRIIASRNDWAGKFSVVETDRIRMRDLGGGEEP